MRSLLATLKTKGNRVENQIKQGEIYFVFLDPVFGREIGGYKTRPVVVVSINDIHQHTRLLTVVPGTKTESSYSNVVRVQKDASNGLRETTFFQCHQVRGIDQGRMTSPPIGRMSRADFQRIQAALRIVLGLLPE
jgi:mRNA-degrading endonuclease toxin of MazEF toxin-antitoxin module